MLQGKREKEQCSERRVTDEVSACITSLPACLLDCLLACVMNVCGILCISNVIIKSKHNNTPEKSHMLRLSLKSDFYFRMILRYTLYLFIYIYIYTIFMHYFLKKIT